MTILDNIFLKNTDLRDYTDSFTIAKWDDKNTLNGVPWWASFHESLAYMSIKLLANPLGFVVICSSYLPEHPVKDKMLRFKISPFGRKK